MEYAAGGDMFEYVVRKGGLRESEARWFFQQLIVAVDYIHRMVSQAPHNVLPLPLPLPLPLLLLPLVICHWSWCWCCWYGCGTHRLQYRNCAGACCRVAGACALRCLRRCCCAHAA